MFGKKKSAESFGNASLSTSASAINLASEIDYLSGDIGKIEIDKKKAKEQSRVRKESLLGTFKKTFEKPKKRAIPDTAQKTIPYKTAYVNGIIETKAKEYTKCYHLVDTNFRTARDDKQAEMYLSYGDFLNYFTPDVRAQIVIWNSTVDKAEFKKNILYFAFIGLIRKCQA